MALCGQARVVIGQMRACVDVAVAVVHPATPLAAMGSQQLQLPVYSGGMGWLWCTADADWLLLLSAAVLE